MKVQNWGLNSSGMTIECPINRTVMLWYSIIIYLKHSDIWSKDSNIDFELEASGKQVHIGVPKPTTSIRESFGLFAVQNKN